MNYILNGVIERIIIMNRKIVFVICLIMTFMLVGTACSKENSALKLAVMPDLDSIPFIVAQQQGYFDENVIIEIYKSPVDRDSALYSGNIDGSISDALAVCLAQEGDFPVYITSKTNGRYGIVAGKDTGITSPKMLEGQEVGMSLNTIIEYVTDRMVLDDGGDPSLLKKTSVPKIPSRLELLQNGQITAVAMPEPFITAAGNEGEIIVRTTEESGINPGVFIFTKDAIEGKSREIKGVYEAYNKAVEYINNTDPSEFMPGVIEILGLPEATNNIILPEYEKAVLPNEEEVMNAMNWLIQKGMLKNEYTYDELVKDIK